MLPATETTLPRIDTEAIRADVGLLLGLAGRDVELVENDTRRRGTEWRGPCPGCGGVDRFAVFQNERSALFNCRSCGRHGDVVQYVMWRQNVDFVAAAKWLGELTDKIEQPVRQERPVSSRAALLTGPVVEEWRYHLDRAIEAGIYHLMLSNAEEAVAARAWLAERGIGPEDIGRFGLGYNAHWRALVGDFKLGPGLLLPRWEVTDSDVVAVACNIYLSREARELTGQRRMFARGSNARTWFNRFAITRPETTAVVVTEGELDAVLLSRFLPPHAVAATTGGADTVADNVAILEGKRVIIALDNDDAGRRGAERWQARLPAAVAATVPEGKDITDFWRAGGDVGDWIMGVLNDGNKANQS